MLLAHTLSHTFTQLEIPGKRVWGRAQQGLAASWEHQGLPGATGQSLTASACSTAPAQSSQGTEAAPGIGHLPGDGPRQSLDISLEAGAEHLDYCLKHWCNSINFFKPQMYSVKSPHVFFFFISVLDLSG